ncbi:MAG: hypothetical protein JW787_02220 [Sedimentisphaerales bacterium]|nr:hypothetical protein [Sedimentisphaerales bacterium]
MKKFTVIFIVLLLFFAVSQTYGEESYPAYSNSTATSANQINTSLNQNVQSLGYGEGGTAIAGGGSSVSDSSSVSVSGDSGAIANISTNSTSNYESRTPPVAMFPPYLPTFSHGGWGTIQAYFPNGPNGNDRMYERAFYPGSKCDMKEIKGVINSLPYDGPLSMMGGVLNCVGKLFGGPDNFHHGKGFEIANSIVRKRRPKERPLYILIDSNINRDYFNSMGYTYVGKVSLEGKVERNWDLVYKAAIAEALPWDVDIMLVSGGMKGVTVGSTLTFPSAGGAYAQTNYSVTLLGGRSTGITEGKGMAMVSAECYRYNPNAARRRAIPEVFYNRIHAKAGSSQVLETSQRIEERIPEEQNVQLYTPAPTSQNQQYTGVKVNPELYEMAGFSMQ